MAEQLMRVVLVVVALGLCLAIILAAWGWWRTQSEIAGIADAAMAAQPGADRVEALLAVVDSEAYKLAERNRAVWTLGVIGNPRALSVLEKHYTGEPCNHERYLCQYELRKAILKCRGQFVGSFQTQH